MFPVMMYVEFLLLHGICRIRLGGGT